MSDIAATSFSLSVEFGKLISGKVEAVEWSASEVRVKSEKVLRECNFGALIGVERLSINHKSAIKIIEIN